MHESEVALYYNSTTWYLPSYWLDQCNLINHEVCKQIDETPPAKDFGQLR